MSATRPTALKRHRAAHAADPQWYKDAIIYELHVRAFQDSTGDGIGDFAGLTQRLPYLADPYDNLDAVPYLYERDGTSLSIRMEDRFPLADILSQTRWVGIPLRAILDVLESGKPRAGAP